jgi:hypothetical protein
MASPAVMAITKSSIPELADFVSRPLQDHHPALSEAVGHNSRLFKNETLRIIDAGTVRAMLVAAEGGRSLPWCREGR